MGTSNDWTDACDTCDMKSLFLPIGSHFAKFNSKSRRWQDILRVGTGHLGGYGRNGEERVKKTFSAVVDTLEANGYTGLRYMGGGSQKTVFTVIKNGEKYVARVTTADAAKLHKRDEIELGAAPELQGIVLPTVEYFEFHVSQDSGNADYTVLQRRNYMSSSKSRNLLHVAKHSRDSSV